MQTIRLTYPIKENLLKQKIVLALGFFDGVHIGHQNLISAAKKVATQKGLPLAVMTFDRHPKQVYNQQKDFVFIDNLAEKTYKMARLGVDYLLVISFTPGFSKMKPQQFVDEVLVRLQADTVVAGFDYTYGPKEIANMTNLPTFVKDRFSIVEVPKQSIFGKKIGSTEIKAAIQNGNMELASKLLGTPFVMSGVVGHGLRNGHKLGYPTVNLVWQGAKVLPKIGVYATKTKIFGKWYNSMTSVGYNVTINEGKKIFIESNLFDFDKEAYGQPIIIKWYKFTRGEVKFSDLPALAKQMDKDKQEIMDYFARKE